MTTESSLADTT